MPSLPSLRKPQAPGMITRCAACGRRFSKHEHRPYLSLQPRVSLSADAGLRLDGLSPAATPPRLLSYPPLRCTEHSATSGADTPPQDEESHCFLAASYPSDPLPFSAGDGSTARGRRPWGRDDDMQHRDQGPSFANQKPQHRVRELESDKTRALALLLPRINSPPKASPSGRTRLRMKQNVAVTTQTASKPAKKLMSVRPHAAFTGVISTVETPSIIACFSIMPVFFVTKTAGMVGSFAPSGFDMTSNCSYTLS